ncbi:MAG: coproporphyrinogen III oxidase family protein [Gemmatimonadales bacterium]|nr:coproporphyrinogen III oxidase family protein [Gemmatimonadales bacterium]
MGLYIHVPFCGSICSYCHFARTSVHDRSSREQYVDGVLAELALRGEKCRVLGDGMRPLDTAYFGGGTPSLLEPDLMRRLVTGTVGTFDPAPDFEFTAEANPESLTRELAEVWLDLGIERVSLGVQSLQDDVLRVLGRSCNSVMARQALKLACGIFPRVSADWILGPDLRIDYLLAELSEAADLGVEHFSLYILEIHQGTALQQDVRRGRLVLPGDELTERLYLAAGEHLEKLGIEQYEVANFSRPGAESRHNGNYWNGRPYLGLGPGAHGFWGRRRYANEADPDRWSEALASGRLPEAEVDPLDLPARRLERAILALRTCRGLPLDWLPAQTLDLEKGQAMGWWKVNGDRLILTRLGFLRVDGFEEALAGRILS